MPLSSAGSAGNREGGRGGCEQVNTQAHIRQCHGVWDTDS